METALRDELAAELWNAARQRRPIAPLSARYPHLTVDDAYAVQGGLRALTVGDGAVLVGHKIGLTSEPIRQFFNIDQPDFGFITDRMVLPDGAAVDAGTFIAPKVEGEVAFRMGADIFGTDITATDVLARTSTLIPVLEILDSRISDWAVRLVDTVADNASSAAVVLGSAVPLDGGVDLAEATMRFEMDEQIHHARGSAVLGHPAESVAWLVRKLSSYGSRIRAGDLVLAGAWGVAVDLKAGSVARATFSSLGSVSLHVG
jgi:2-keto-4-pentenoate hydratase